MKPTGGIVWVSARVAISMDSTSSRTSPFPAAICASRRGLRTSRASPNTPAADIISKAQFGYGYYECLSRPFMAGKGVHTSFWQRSGSVPNNNIFEIDSYEIDSTQYLATNNLYLLLARKDFKESPWPHRGHVPFKLQPDGSFLDAYEYTPDGVVFYDNGKIVAKAEWDGLTAAQCVWLTALNGCGKVNDAKLPGESTFDYFRYYAKDYPGVNLLPNGSFEYNQDKVDAAKPVSWVMDGDKAAVKVIEGDAAHDRYKLRLGRQGAAYNTTLRQKLEYIRNGDYLLTALVRRSSGSQTASLRVGNTGGAEYSADIPAGETWTRITIPKISVTNHSATISIQTQGEAGQWLEIDDIRFMKPPLPGQKARNPKPFVVCGDPIWSLARKEPITFTGDDKFYFFDRNVGYGDAISVSFVMNPAKLASTAPIERIPAKGDAGWAVQLRADGESGVPHRQRGKPHRCHRQHRLRRRKGNPRDLCVRPRHGFDFHRRQAAQKTNGHPANHQGRHQGRPPRSGRRYLRSGR